MLEPADMRRAQCPMSSFPSETRRTAVSGQHQGVLGRQLQRLRLRNVRTGRLLPDRGKTRRIVLLGVYQGWK